MNNLLDEGIDSDTGTSASNMSHSDGSNTTEDLTGDYPGSPDNSQKQNLAVDSDQLENVPCTCNQIWGVLVNDLEWRRVFKPIHVNQFRGPSGSNLPRDLNVSSSLVNYFQLFSQMKCYPQCVKTQQVHKIQM